MQPHDPPPLASHDLTIDWLQAGDAPTAVAIDRASFVDPLGSDGFRELITGSRIVPLMARIGEPSPRPHPWSKRTWLAQSVGFLVYRVDHLSIEVLRVAVSPEHRRKGVGTALLKAIERKLDRNRPQARFTVPDDNLPAQLWLKACDWRAVDVLEDAYLFFKSREGAVHAGA